MANISLPLGIDSLDITAQTLDKQGNIILDVKSKRTEIPCRKCGKLINKKRGFGDVLKVRHLSILDTPVYLRIRVVRYQCLDCDNNPTSCEEYDWMERKSKTTKGLDKYINRNLIHSTVEDVSKKEGITYDIVESALHRCVNTTVDWTVIKDLSTIGIDEIAIKKGQNDYITIVSVKDDQDKLFVIGVLPGRLKETVKSFLESIPPHLRKTVKSVCTDMCDSFVSAAKEVFSSRVIVIDRFHLAQLYRSKLDNLRIKEMKRLKQDLKISEYAKLENMMWILRKNHECLSKKDKVALELLYKYSPKLKAAYKAALRLTHIFNAHHNRKIASSKISRWVVQMQKSDVRCFDGFIKTLEKYKSGILNYFKNRKTSGFVEGLNNKIKVLKRRCYGLYKTASIFQRLVLDLKGYQAFA